MSSFTPQFLDELRARISLEDVVGRRVKLIRRGREYVGLSPFQKEKTPSFTVVPDKGFYHCFSSGEHGDVIDFVMKTEGLTFPEAVERLAGQAGMEIPVDSPEERERAKQRQSLQDVLETAADHFAKMLRMPEGRQALAYLKDRGLTDETIAKFRLGFAPESNTTLKTALARTGVSEDMMLATGLIRKPDDGRAPYDYFRRRVIFPITDRRGRVIAFGGRILGDGEPKYLNSPESQLFVKRHVLYGLGQALKDARDAGTMIVTEGYMDVIALHQAGFDNAVAPLGTALTEDQLQMMWRIVPEPVLCFDGDNAGQKAAERVADRALPLLKPGFGVRFAHLPAGEDPDSLIKAKGAEAMREVLDATEPLSEVLWRMETRGQSPATPEERAALEDRLTKHTLQIEDPALRSHFLRAFKDRLWEAFRAQRDSRQGGRQSGGGGRRWRGGDAPLPSVVGQPGRAVDSAHRVQQVLLAAVINHPAIFEEFGERLGEMAFSDPDLDRLRQETVGLLAATMDMQRETLLDGLKGLGLARELSALLDDPLIRQHRRIRPGSDDQEARETWQESAAVLEKAGIDADVGRVREALAGDLSEESWQRQLAVIRARIGEEGD